MAINLTDPVFTDEAKAREYLESIRWPDGPICPHCGEAKRVYRLNGKSHRPGLIHCNSCEGSFTVTTGSVMESSHLPLNKWVLAYRLMASSKKGMSAHQLHRSIGVTYKTAWFLWHRIREAMRDTSEEPLGGTGKTVEADETYVGRQAAKRRAAAGCRRPLYPPQSEDDGARHEKDPGCRTCGTRWPRGREAGYRRQRTDFDAAASSVC